MKTMRRWVALLLAVALTGALAGCSKGDEGAMPSPTPKIVMDDDLERLAGMSGDTELVTVDGEPIYAEDYFYWLAYTLDYVSNMGLQMGSAEIDWGTMVGDKTLEETAKSDALSSAQMYRQLMTKAEAMGCTVEPDVLAEYQASIAGSIEDMGGEEFYILNMRYAATNQGALDRNGMTGLLYQALAEKLYGEDGEQAPTAEEISVFAKENDFFKAKHILLATADLQGERDPSTGALPKLEEAVVAEKYALAEDIVAQLEASDEPEVLFDELMNEYSEDSGLATNSDGYEFGPGEMVTAFEEATRELDIGETSGIVESEYGYHIILRLDPDSEEMKNTWVNYQMEALVSQWSDEAEVVHSDAYDALDVSDFYDELTALRAELEIEFQALQEASQAEEEANAPADTNGDADVGADAE